MMLVYCEENETSWKQGTHTIIGIGGIGIRATQKTGLTSIRTGGTDTPGGHESISTIHCLQRKNL